MTHRTPFTFDNVRLSPLLLMVVLAATFITVRLQLSPIAENVALLYLNHSLKEGPNALETRVSRIEAAKTLLQDWAPATDERRITRQLDFGQANVTRQDTLGIGDHFFQLDDLSHAERWYSHSVQLYPESGAAWYRLAYTYENRSKIEAALHAYRESISVNTLPELDVGKSDPYCRMGALLREHEIIRNLHQAQDYLESGIKLNQFGSPQVESECYFELGNTLRWQGTSQQEYVTLYRKAVSVNPDHVLANILLGVTTYQLTGDIQESETYIRQSLSVLPTVRAYEELAKMYEAEEDYDRAIALYQEALDLAISNASIPSLEASIERLRAIQNADDDERQP